MYLAAKLRLKLVSIRLAPYYVPIAADLVFPRYTTYSEQVYCYHVIHVRATERKKNEEEDRERIRNGNSCRKLTPATHAAMHHIARCSCLKANLKNGGRRFFPSLVRPSAKGNITYRFRGM